MTYETKEALAPFPQAAPSADMLVLPPNPNNVRNPKIVKNPKNPKRKWKTF